MQDAEIYDTIGTYEYEAFLLPEDIVVVDIDDIDPDIVDALLDEFNIKTMYSHTDEGAHLYFKKPKRYKHANDGPTPLGFKVEHKHRQCVITYDGITRELHNEGEIEYLPFILTIDERYPVMYGMEDNDGRYNKMLSMNGYLGKRANKRQIMQFINMYVLGEPMSGKQLNLILNSELDSNDHDDVEGKSKEDKKKDALDELIEIFKPVRYNGVFYFWDVEDECWETDENVLNRLLYKKFYGFGATAIEEYKKHITNLAHIYKGYKLFPIQFKNGYLYDGVWTHGVYDDFTPYMIDFDFIPNSPITNEMDTFFRFITEDNKELIDYLFQAFGQVLEVDPDRRNKYPRVHTFLGEGGNGKGMIMRLLKNAVGKINSSSVKLHKFNDKDELITLRGKLLNISEDENGTVLKDSMLAKIKNVAAADEMTVRGIYKAAESNILIMPALFVTSNHAFPTYEKGESVKRRFFWIEFNQPVGGQEWLNDEFIRSLNSDASMQWFVSRMVEGYFQVRREGYMDCQVIDDFTEEYHSINNNIEEYTREFEDKEFFRRPVSECYEEYEAWAKGERKYAMPIGDFKLFICKKYDMKESVGKLNVQAVTASGEYYEKRVSKRIFIMKG